MSSRDFFNAGRTQRLLSSAAVAGLGLGVLVAAPSLADPSPIDLVLGGDVRIDGGATDNFIGWVLDSAGDVNGDGYDDVLMGASDLDNNGRTDSGSTYVVFGGATPANRDLASLGAAGFRIDGAAAFDRSGAAVAGVGDINADGYDDILIGAAFADNNGRDNSGSTYVLYGSTSTANRDLAALGSGGFRIDGAAAFEQSGNAIAGPGDINRDGYADILIGAPGADNNGRAISGSSYVVFGSTATANRDLAALGTGGFRIDGAAAFDQSGNAIAGTGDINGDGYNDILIGANQADNNGRTDSGSTYVVYGSTSAANRDLAVLGAGGFRIDNAAAFDQSGNAIAGAGDVNADGRPDLVIGAPGADSNGRNLSGSSYVVFGSTGPTNLDLASLGSTGFRIDGAAATDQSGSDVAGAGDVNADGFGDVLVAAPFADNNGRDSSGSTYVVYGSSAVTNRDLAGLGSGGFRVDGAAAFDYSGLAVAGAGDVNGDRGDDIVVGAPFADNNGRAQSGSSYLLFGTPKPTPVATLTVTARKANRAVPRRGKVTLVREVAVGPGQTATISVRVKPKRAKSRMKFTKTPTRLKVRTKRAPRSKITVKITSTGTGFIPTSWKRTWKVR